MKFFKINCDENHIMELGVDVKGGGSHMNGIRGVIGIELYSEVTTLMCYNIQICTLCILVSSAINM